MDHTKTAQKNNKLPIMIGVGIFMLAAIIALIVWFFVRTHNNTNTVIVATVNGVEVTHEDVFFRIRQAESILAPEYFAMFPSDERIHFQRAWTGGRDVGRTIREDAVLLAAVPLLFEQYARDNDLQLPQAMIDQVQSDIDNFIEQMGQESFDRAMLVDQISGRDHLAHIFTLYDIIDLVVAHIISNPAEFARFEQYMPPEDDMEMLGAKHILISFASHASPEAAEALALELHARAVAGEDFDTLIATYGEDPGMVASPQGYTFVSGVMVESFEEATRALEIGEISGLVHSDFGIHIIKRTEPIPEEVQLPWGVTPRTEQNRMAEAVHLGFEAMAQNADIVFKPALDDVSLDPAEQ